MWNDTIKRKQENEASKSSLPFESKGESTDYKEKSIKSDSWYLNMVVEQEQLNDGLSETFEETSSTEFL